MTKSGCQIDSYMAMAVICESQVGRQHFKCENNMTAVIKALMAGLTALYLWPPSAHIDFRLKGCRKWAKISGGNVEREREQPREGQRSRNKQGRPDC